jgi:high-affinity iron transporter
LAPTRLLSVDYGGAVGEDWRVVSQSEYAEMVEFAQQVHDRLEDLPSTAAQPSLVARADALQGAIAHNAPPAEVAGLAKSLKDPMPLVPGKPPDLARAAALYTEQCAACHGATGAGNGSAAKELKPPPVAFNEVGRLARAASLGSIRSSTRGRGHRDSKLRTPSFGPPLGACVLRRHARLLDRGRRTRQAALAK